MANNTIHYNSIILPVTPQGMLPTVYVNQYDKGRALTIKPDGSWSQGSVPTVKINGRKADGHVFEYTESDKWNDTSYIINKTVSSSGVLTVTIYTTEQMTAAAGDALVQLTLESSGGAVRGTLNFIMHVQEQPYANGDPSGSDFPEIIAMATVQMERAEAAAGVAATSAGNAADSETNALSYKNAAEAARDRSETAADKAEEWSAHPPQVNANGNWDVWNIPDQQYEDSGIDCGPTITLDPDGAITMLDPDGTARIDNISQSDTDPVFHFYIPRGKGISSIAKTGTSGLIDTYTITYSDGATYTYNIVNGKDAYTSAVEGGYQGTEQDFYADLGVLATAATTATNAAQAASGSANSADGREKDSESWAVGKRDGTDVPSTDPAYENNAKYYSQQAAASAAATANVSTGNTLKVAINPTASEIASYADGAIWIETPPAYLIFSSDSPFVLQADEGVSWNGTLEYSLDGNTWTTWNGSQLSGTASQPIYLRGSGNTHIMSSGAASSHKWTFTGKHITGNIETLLDYQTVANGQHPTMDTCCYWNMFNGCATLVTPPELPAVTMKALCYENMFKDCTALTVAPELPALTMANGCYSHMFDGCTSLTIPPELPATTLKDECYSGMFANCTALSKLPRLSAMVLEESCYSLMFYKCSAIKLSASETGAYQYAYRIPTAGTGTDDTSTMSNMFYQTGGTFTGTPTINTTYYTDHEPV